MTSRGWYTSSVQTKDIIMNEMLLKKKLNTEKRIKSFTINKVSEDKDSKTHVKKSFVYLVSHAKELESKSEAPQIHITKSIDNKKKIENMIFQVKGQFFMPYNRQLVSVKFRHTLNIEIYWKNKIFSPKKSAVLTK